jgi:hypothetical protein
VGSKFNRFVINTVTIAYLSSIVLILLSFGLGRGYFIVDNVEEIGKPALDKV